ncbi:MAG: hypothetical protein KF784_03710 [Fimbriimonadaceae bacterium]|nr:hypothetical protein [Fimbriimonadaceae bacterium]
MMRTRSLWLIAAGLALFVGGCSAESAKQQAQQKLDEAAASVKKSAEDAATDAIDKAVAGAKENMAKAAEDLYRQAMEFGATTPDTVLTASKEAMGKVKTGIEKAFEPDSPQRKWANNLAKQMARIDATQMLKTLQARSDEVLKQAQTSGEVAAKDADEARKELREKNPSFRDIDDQRIAAQKQLAEMTEQLKQAVPLFSNEDPS